ncbi:MAG: ATP-binding cassette domain-containing protein [Chloroflexi bacterium]|nr:ATP-binding cassette domain-containing protein [Chloroflexota bacterium]
MTAISVKNLSKYYEVHQKEPGLVGSLKSFVLRKSYDVKAVDDISFTIESGELVGFLGPNGAGKTTTLKVLSGLLYPTGGEVSVLGYTPWQRQAEFQRQFALVMGQKSQVWWDLPPMETFLINKEIYEVPDAQFRDTLDELVQILELEKVINVQARKLSLGERMKCELLAALLHRPQVLFLDEPTIGLDVVMQQNIRNFVREYNARYGATVILTSHYMRDVEALCDRVLIIDHGHLVFDGDLDTVVRRYADYKFMTVTFESPVAESDLATYGAVVAYRPRTTTLRIARNAVPQVSAQLLQDYPVLDLNIVEPEVDDVVRQLFSGGKPAYAEVVS